MRSVFLVVALIISSAIAFSQDCSKEQLSHKQGTWKAGEQGAISNVSPVNLVREKSTLANIHKMVTSQYQPTGCQISYSTVFGKYSGEGQTWIADPYHYQLYVLRYLCDGASPDKSKYYVDYSTPTTAVVAANAVYSLNSLFASNIPTDDSRGYFKLVTRPVKRDGYYFMGEEIVGDNGMPSEIKEYRWLITYNDTLPFYYVSRKEYLLLQKKKLQQALIDIPSEKEYTNKYLNNINEYLKKSDVELNKPAICMWNDEEHFETFVDEGTRGSFIAVKPNLAYYHKNLPQSSPQFFTVVYKVSKGDAVFVNNYEAIKKSISFASLQSMLGK